MRRAIDFDFEKLIPAAVGTEILAVGVVVVVVVVVD